MNPRVTGVVWDACSDLDDDSIDDDVDDDDDVDGIVGVVVKRRLRLDKHWIGHVCIVVSINA
jgi:hypothetical protein